MRNILLTIAYDGTHFSGWQRQPAQRTVQGELERVLSELCRQQVELAGTSRTDAGVHAFGQRACFHGDFGIPTDRIKEAANNLLAGAFGRLMSPGDVRILNAEEVPERFHARFDAKGKKYVYQILNGGEPDLFLRNYCCHIKRPLDTKQMQAAADRLVGTHDFRCFMAQGGKEMEDTVRTIYSLEIKEQPQGPQGQRKIELEVRGNGFLYNMVRIITGTLIDVGTGRKAPDDMESILEGRDRSRAGFTAPPQGLYLAEIYFE